MATADEKRMKPARGLMRRVGRFLGIGLIVFLFLLAVLYFFRGPLLAEPLAGFVADAMSEQMGGQFELDRVEGGWFADLELVGLRTIKTPEAGSLKEIAFDRLTIEYDLLAAFGSRPQDMVKSLRIENFKARLDLTAPSDPPQEPAPTLEELSELLPQEFPDIKITGSCEILTSEGAIKVDSLDLKGNKKDLELALGGITHLDLLKTGAPPSISIHVHRPDPKTLSITTDDDLWGLRIQKAQAKVGEGDELGAELAATFAAGNIDLKLENSRYLAKLSGLKYQSLPQWIADLTEGIKGLPTSGTLAAEASGQLDSSSAAIDFSVQAKNIEWPAVRGGHISARGQAEGTGIRVDLLEAEAAGCNAVVKGLALELSQSFPLTQLAELTLTAADFKSTLERLELAPKDTPWPPHPLNLEVRLSESTDEILRIEKLDLRVADAKISLNGDAKLPESKAAWEQVTLNLALNGHIPALSQLLAPRLDLDGTEGNVQIEGRLSGRLESPLAGLEVRVQELRFKGHDAGQGEIDFDLNWPELRLKNIDLRGGLVQAKGSAEANLEDQSIAAGQLRIESPNISELLHLLDPDLNGQGHVLVEGDLRKDPGPWDAAFHGDLRVRGDSLVLGGRSWGTLDFQLKVADEILSIPTLNLKGDVVSLEAQARLNLQSPRSENFKDLALEVPRLSLEILDLAGMSKLFDGIPPLSGSLRIDGSLAKPAGQAWQETESQLRARAKDFVYSDVTSDKIDLVFKSVHRRFDLDRLFAKGPWGKFESKGSATFDLDGGGIGSIESLQAQIDGHPLELEKPAGVSWTANGDLSLPAVSLRAFAGRIKGHLNWQGNDQGAKSATIDSELDIQSIDLAALPGELELTGKLDGRLVVAGQLESPSIDLNLAAPNFRWRDIDGNLDFRLSQRAKALELSLCELRLPQHRTTLTAKGSLPAHINRNGLNWLPWSVGDLEFRVSNETSSLAQVFGSPPELDWEQITFSGRLIGSALKTEAKATQVLWNSGNPTTDIPMDLALDGILNPEDSRSTLKVSSLDGLNIEGQARLAAGIGTHYDADTLQRLLDAALTGKASAKAPDLAKFKDMVPGVLRLGGKLALDVALKGSATQPEYSGRLDVSDLSFRLEGDLPGLDEGEIKTTFDAERVLIAKAGGQLGFSPISLEGEVTLPRDGRELAVDLRLVGENALLARSRYLRLRSDLDLAIKGPLSAIEISGEVRISDALYTQPMSFVGTSARTADNKFQLFSFREPPLSDLKFDIAILADQSIFVRNNVLSGTLSTDLRLLGNGMVPRPDGRVTIDKLRVTLPFSKLSIARGAVFFDRGNPFSPRLDIAGNTRMQGYDLKVLINGRLPNQTVGIVAEPFLPQEDALFLLTVGATRTGLQDEGLTRAALTRAGSMISDSLLGDLFGPADPDQESLADRFDLSVGRSISDTGQPTIEMEYKIVERIFLRAERDRYDDYNLGAIWRLKFK